MPRKKKGLKREHSDAASLVPTTSTSAAPSAATVIAADADGSSSSRTNSDRDITHNDQRPALQPHKKARHLSFDDEDRLGRLSSLSRWKERVAQGRGAAVCVFGTVDNIASTSTSDGSTCHVQLHCQPVTTEASGASTASPHSSDKLTAIFVGPLAERVFQALGDAHRLAPPARIHLSGFAATLSPQQQANTATFTEGKVVMRFFSASTDHQRSGAWIELLNDQSPAKSESSAAEHHLSSPRPAALCTATSAQPPASNDWFATPAPSTRSALSTDLASAASVGGSIKPLPKGHGISTGEALPGSLKEKGALKSSIRPGAPILSDKNATPENQSNHGPSAASSEPAAVPSATTATRVAFVDAHGNAAVSRNRNALPSQSMFQLGSFEYSAISSLRNGQQANVVGVVIRAGEPRRAAGGSCDLNINIKIADVSCSTRPNPQGPVSLNDSLTIMLFASTMDRIAHPIRVGQILLLRKIAIQDFQGRRQAVGKREQPWSWSIYDPVSGDIRTARALGPSKPLSQPEKDHMRELAIWYGQLREDELGVYAGSGRPMLRLDQISENLFFDSTVEVLKVYTHSQAPDLYVTDYTSHPLFYRGTDHYLGLETPLEYDDDGEGGGHVFQIGLWNIYANLAGALKTGDFIRIQNVRAKMNPRGMLVGGLGSADDTSIKIKTLKPPNEERLNLEKRRAEFLKRHGQRPPEGPEGVGPACDEASADFVAGHAVGDDLALNVGAAQHGVGSQPVTRQDAVELRAKVQQHQQWPRGGSPSAVQAKEEERDCLANSTKGTLEVSLPTPGQRPLPTISPSRVSRTTTNSQDSASRGSKNAQTSGRAPETSTPRQEPNVALHLPGDDHAAASPEVTVRCKAPSSVPNTALSTLLTTSTCPGMYKVTGHIVSVRPERLQEWARIECRACKKLLPLEELFCTRCGEEDGDGETNLAYTLRFAIMLEESDGQLHSRQDGEGKQDRIRIPILFNDQAATSFLPDIEPRKIHAESRSALRKLSSRMEALLGRPLSHSSRAGMQSTQDAGPKGPVVQLAIYSYPSTEAGRTVRRFASLKNANVLTSTS